MVDSYKDDKSIYRTPGGEYAIDDKIGRSDSKDKIAVTNMSVSSTAAPLPTSPLGRRNFIRVKNTDLVDSVAILTASGVYSDGFPVAAGESWEESTDADFWIVASGGNIDVEVYERSSRFNYGE